MCCNELEFLVIWSALDLEWNQISKPMVTNSLGEHVLKNWLFSDFYYLLED